jgi:DNA-binding transcriptional MocR family regulator
MGRTADTAARLRQAIAAGTYPVGARLPSLRSLAEQWRVSINTVVAAYRQLEREGRISPLPRLGFRVVPPRQPPPPPLHLPAPTLVDLADLLRSAEMREDGPVPLGVAIPRPELLPLTALRRCLLAAQRAHPDACLAYDVAPGQRAAREAIARRLLARGAAADPEQIVITHGAQEGLQLVLRAICAAGACVAVATPAYPGFLQAMASQGLAAIGVPSSPATGISLPLLAQALERHPIAAVLLSSTWQNPDGATMPTAARRDLVALCRRHQVPLIDDDTYGELAHDASHEPLCLAEAHGGLVVHIGSFSKCIAPGLRLGFVVAGRWTDAVVRHKIAVNVATAVAPQLAVAQFLDSGAFDRHRRQHAARLGGIVQRCAAAVLAAFPPGTQVTRPRGGFVLWVTLPATIDAQRLAVAARRAGIGIAPGPLFAPDGGFRHHIRLTAGWWDPVIANAIATVGNLAKRMA